MTLVNAIGIGATVSAAMLFATSLKPRWLIIYMVVACLTFATFESNGWAALRNSF